MVVKKIEIEMCFDDDFEILGCLVLCNTAEECPIRKFFDKSRRA